MIEVWLQRWLRGTRCYGFASTMSMLSRMNFHLATCHLVLNFCSLGRLLALDCEQIVLELEVCGRHAGIPHLEKEILSGTFLNASAALMRWPPTVRPGSVCTGFAPRTITAGTLMIFRGLGSSATGLGITTLTLVANNRFASSSD